MSKHLHHRNTNITRDFLKGINIVLRSTNSIYHREGANHAYPFCHPLRAVAYSGTAFLFIQSLSRFHEVSLVSLLCDEYERELTREIASYCASIDLVPLSKARAYANCLLALPTPMPLRVAYYRSPAFITTIRK